LVYVGQEFWGPKRPTLYTGLKYLNIVAKHYKITEGRWLEYCQTLKINCLNPLYKYVLPQLNNTGSLDQFLYVYKTHH
jgi:hypothetical protein